jgi:CubicO group peptidase (beta-lactamase class C family)
MNTTMKQHPFHILLLLLALAAAAPAQPLTTSTPEEQGVASSAILAFVQALEKEVDAPHGFVLLRHGQTIAQGWWAPYEQRAPHILYSLSKSFTSTAIGLLADEGKLDIDDPVISFFPDDAPKNPSDNLKAMRIRDLLTMTTGHAQDTIGKVAQGGDDNWARSFLAIPVDKRPGTYFVYNSGASYMLSAIVHKVAGKPALDLLNERLFKPLGIEKATWDADPKGVNVGGWGLSITTGDIAKLGQLYLQKGVWNDQRILSEAWVRLATSPQTANGTNPQSDWNQGYGFQFWRCRNGAYRGDGAFGQFCVVMPEQDMVLAITAGQGDMQKSLNLVWQHLLPGVKAQSMPPDGASRQALAKKLATLAHPAVKGEAASALAGKVNGKPFTLDANPAGIKTVTFEFKNDASIVVIQTDQGEQKFDLGSGEWKKSTVPFHKLGLSAAATSRSEPVAASGAWTAADHFAARAWLTETPFRLDMEFTFDAAGKAVTVSTRLHPLQGKAVTIKGTVR